jgi:TPR repeat protein
MYNLGVILEPGDQPLAVTWFRRAAQAGDTDAMTALATLLQDSDPAEARHWREKAQ